MSFRYKDYFIVQVLINLGTNGLSDIRVDFALNILSKNDNIKPLKIISRII